MGSCLRNGHGDSVDELLSSFLVLSVLMKTFFITLTSILLGTTALNYFVDPVFLDGTIVRAILKC